jgi:hypothetical protein
MRRNGELLRLFVRAMPSKISDASSATLTKVRIEEVAPVFAVLAASLAVASVFLATERCMYRLLQRRLPQEKYLHQQRSTNILQFNRSQQLFTVLPEPKESNNAANV